ncbi:hypothetical protein [Streptomyces sp. TLI_185]|uniref:hypothetical protein n=1 Tax=Streptomyces sp. TLI_185 TaxID=2485151 RepID=UPI000F4DC2FD|nr:hypothetical protein [Streptomyces sp. TLI_185]RPF34253.1 hypothetical protein EDD92_4202 [Streptomyces sp. TLI_185]
MTEAELVAAALAAGARLGGARGAVVGDVYLALRETVRWRLAGDRTGDHGFGVRVLDAHETDPEVWGSRLVGVLTGSGVVEDREILAAARILLGAERRACRLALDTRGVRADRDQEARLRRT